jgi:manganese transport system ATP-binding protein
MTPALDVRGLRVRYGAVTALDDASFTLEPGRVCGLVGMNGSGKSTLFKSVLGLVRPDAGTVRILGDAPAAARRHRAVGYVPQSEEVDWTFPVSVRDVVLTGRYGHLGTTRRPRRDDHTAVADAVERVGLADLADRQIGNLSGGQRKRAFVARALAQAPRVLLLDEPFAGVDRRTEEALTVLLREFAAGGGTVLVSSHDLSRLPDLADESVLLRRTVLMHGPTTEVVRPENLARAFGLDVGEDR